MPVFNFFLCSCCFHLLMRAAVQNKVDSSSEWAMDIAISLSSIILREPLKVKPACVLYVDKS